MDPKAVEAALSRVVVPALARTPRGVLSLIGGRRRNRAGALLEPEVAAGLRLLNARPDSDFSTLPVEQARLRVEEEARPRRLAKSAPQEPELWGTATILLVEDEAMVRTVAERALARHGYKVLTANNGEEALERLEQAGEQVALLISDVVMPLMDGPTMVREARKTHPDMPILFMSGYAEEQLRKSIDIANVAFLPKPFSVQELAEAVRRVLAAAK